MFQHLPYLLQTRLKTKKAKAAMMKMAMTPMTMATMTTTEIAFVTLSHVRESLFQARDREQ